MILRHVEYMRRCDGHHCYEGDVSHWQTRAEAEEAALKDGWVKCSRGRLLCPSCARKAEAKASKAEAQL